jgi:hypothetical protein
MTRLAVGTILTAASLLLGGCYETASGVLDRGTEIPAVAGSYRCVNDKDREVSTAIFSTPARLGADDVIYVAAMDKHRYAIRIAALPADLLLLEARGESERAQHVFVQQKGNDTFALLIADTRSARARERLAALAAKHGVTIAFPEFGPPHIEGPRNAERAFLLAHTPAVMERTATCRRVP